MKFLRLKNQQISFQYESFVNFVTGQPNNKRMVSIVHQFTMRSFFLLLAIFVVTSIQAQQDKSSRKERKTDISGKQADKDQKKDSYFDAGYLRYSDYVYKESIATVLFHRVGWELTSPIMIYGSDERLLLSFDDLEGDYRVWQYTVIHCDAAWNPTDLWQNEYISGFPDEYIRDYRFSFNTLQAFTNYSLVIPNENFNFTLSGNYILKVFPEGQPDNPILTRRFFVVEPRVTVKAIVKAASSINERYTHHEVQFSVFTAAYQISEPLRDLKVIILQNSRWDNAIQDLKPMMIRGDELDYRYTDGTNTFEAGNEFRYLDIKSLRYNSERIRAIENRTDGYHVELLHDKVRATAPYITYGDINGRKLIKTEDANDPITESEYVWVDFFLPFETPVAGGGIYIMGALTDWQFNAPGNSPANVTGYGRMEYNFARQGYEARLYLKQGYYNYLYAFLPNGQTRAETALIEGNRFEARNSYTILVYHREPGARYDRLIAAEVVDN